MTRGLRLAVLYLALGMGANAAVAEGHEDLLQGDMRAMLLHEEAVDPGAVRFTDAEGNEMGLDAFAGQYVVLNFWATWCAPCRVEMPSLNRLQQTLGGEGFRVVTIATGRNPIPAINRFFEAGGITDLPIYLDPRQTMSRQMGVLSLPVTVLLDPEGQEVGRLRGDADWASDETLAFLRAWSGQSGQSGQDD